MSNKFAGIDSRFLIALGAGNNWTNTDTFKFKTFYSLTYTFQDDVVENPFMKTDFAGLPPGLRPECQAVQQHRFRKQAGRRLQPGQLR